MTFGGSSYGDTAIADTEATDEPTFENTVISAAYTVQDSDLSGGSATLGTTTINYNYTVLEGDISGGTTIDTQPITFSYTPQTSDLTPVLLNQGIDYSYTPQEMIVQVPGTLGEISVLIDGERINTYTDIEIKKRLNEVDTFSFNAFIEDSSERQLIQEGKEVKFVESYNDLLFKGVLNEVEYKSSFRAKCEGNGMVQKLLNRKTNRDTYNNTAGDDIVKAEVDQSVMSYGTIETAPQVSVRFDHDNLARAVAGVANATGYDWYIDQEFSDDFDVDYLNFVDQAGSSTVQDTFSIGDNALMVDRNKDDGFVANDITLLGQGDGINQLEANVFAATTHFTDTAQVIDEGESTSFSVDDATQLGSTGDNLKVRVGGEVMDVDITDSTTLSINSRGLDDYEGNETEQIKHYDNIRVWLKENVTQGIGPFTPNNAESGSSIDTYGVREQRETDKTIVDKSTLEKTADLELKNRFEDIFRVQIEPTEPRVSRDLSLGDTVKVEDLTAMDVSDEFRIVGLDVKRASSEEGTVLHLANRPRRLTERLSEIESNTDTLNAHMQGATNFNGERFEDNADNTHPLTNKLFVPDDVVEINKFQLTFTRESFRGYVQDQGHSHDINASGTAPSTNTRTNPSQIFVSAGPQDDNQESLFRDWDFGNTQANFDMTMPSVDNDQIYQGGYITVEIGRFAPQGSTESSETFDFEILADDGSVMYDDSITVDPGTSGGGTVETRRYQVEATDAVEGETVSLYLKGGELDSTDVSESPKFQDYIEATLMPYGSHDHDLNIDATAQSAGNPVYGVFEPASEPDIDVEVYVDGNLVTTKNNVSVGDEITTPIDLKNDLSDPLTGTYHDIELKPVDTGGGNGGRCRLTADVVQKVFIESTL